MVIRRAVFFLIFLGLAAITIPHEPSLGAESSLPPVKKQFPTDAPSKKVLENGLIILAQSYPPKDLVSIDIKIEAGSGLEGEYLGSGISHFVEHMVFKGTNTRKAGQIEREIKSYGGFINGAATKDLTDFNVTVPSIYFPNVLSILKDMLLNASFDKDEVEREKAVILKEINLYEDEPQSMLMKALYETAYLAHPYKYPVIGYSKRVESLTREDLVRYYEARYVPNRMVIAVAGGIDKEAAVAAIEKEFKDFRQSNYETIVQAAEPAQIARRYLEKTYQTTLSYLAMGFHSTGILDRDLFAMDVLSMILGAGDESILNKALVKKKELIYSVACWNYTTSSPGLFVITAITNTSTSHIAEKCILDEIDKIKKTGVAAAELRKAKRMVEAGYIFSRETIEEQAADMCSSEILTGSHDFALQYLFGVRAVTGDDIKRVANLYLRDDNLTVVKVAPPSPQGTRIKGPETGYVPAETKKETLENGLILLLREDRKTPAVAVTAAFSGGLCAENEKNNGISNLTARMLLKGTHLRGESEIKGAIEALGGSMDSFSGLNSFGINISVLKDDLDFALPLLNDILNNPVFSEEELLKEKRLVLAAIKEEDDDIFQNGSNMLKRSLFKNHPYGLRYLGEGGSISSIKQEDLFNFYNYYCAPNNMVLAISGDIDPESLKKRIRDIFGGMKKKLTPEVSPKGTAPNVSENQTVHMDKEQALLMTGFRTINIKDPDRYAFEVLCSVLSGYSGRLYNELRDRRSLAYSLGCAQRLGVDLGYLVLYVATTKEKLEEARVAVFNQLKDIRSKFVTDDELVLAKRELISGYNIRIQTNDAVALKIALDELYGLGYNNIYKYADNIEKVTKEDLKRVAARYLGEDNCAEVIITPG